MDAQTQSRARLTMHAIERHSHLLVEALDASLVEVSPECVRWSAICDPRCWLTPTLASFSNERDSIRSDILARAAKYALASDELEQFIRAGAAGHECNAKGALREDVVTAAEALLGSLKEWIREPDPDSDVPAKVSGLFPQYVPRAVPKAADDFFGMRCRSQGRAKGGAVKAFLSTTCLAIIASMASAQPIPSQAEWSSLAGDDARSATRLMPVSSFATPRWQLPQSSTGSPIRFIGPANPVATVLPLPRLFTTGVVEGSTRAIAVDAEGGQVVWMTPIPDLIYDSWSSPAIDPTTETVLYAAGSSVIALRMSDGSEAWRRDLAGPPVNVSPVVTRDLAMRNRVFVTDYGGFGGPSSLYCINVSPYHATINPYAPGELVWAVSIGSSTGGTPTYLDGVVYVCSTGLEASGFGEIRAFDARAVTNPQPLWVFANPIMEGFFGGLTIREAPGGPFIYAATYAFYGELSSANLVKIHARTGSLVWSVPSNRTDSIPVVLNDGRIVLATGLPGFGSVPMVQMFQDQGTAATQLWNTAHPTWNDLNQNGFLDLGEFLLVGGWTTQPVLTQARVPNATPRLLVGAIPTGDDYFGPYTDLFEFDISKLPSDPNFVVQRTTAAGSSSAMLGSGVYSVGTGGLAALGPRPPRPDLNTDGRIGLDDLYDWENAQGVGDVDRSNVVDSADREFLMFELRRNEFRDMAARRR